MKPSSRTKIAQENVENGPKWPKLNSHKSSRGLKKANFRLVEILKKVKGNGTF